MTALMSGGGNGFGWSAATGKSSRGDPRPAVRERADELSPQVEAALAAGSQPARPPRRAHVRAQTWPRPRAA